MSFYKVKAMKAEKWEGSPYITLYIGTYDSKINQ